MAGTTLGSIQILAFNWLAGMEKWCLYIIISILFLNNELAIAFSVSLLMAFLCLCGLGHDSCDVKAGSMCNSLGRLRWLSLNHFEAYVSCFCAVH